MDATGSRPSVVFIRKMMLAQSPVDNFHQRGRVSLADCRAFGQRVLDAVEILVTQLEVRSTDIFFQASGAARPRNRNDFAVSTDEPCQRKLRRGGSVCHWQLPVSGRRSPDSSRIALLGNVDCLAASRLVPGRPLGESGRREIRDPEDYRQRGQSRAHARRPKGRLPVRD